MAAELLAKIKAEMEHLANIWDTLLTVGMAIFGFAYKSTRDDLKEVNKTLHDTRVEMARDYVPRTTLVEEMAKVMAGINRLDDKVDELLKTANANK